MLLLDASIPYKKSDSSSQGSTEVSKKTAKKPKKTLSPRESLPLEAKLPQSQGSTELYEYDTKIMKDRQEAIQQYQSYTNAETKKGKRLSTQHSLLRKVSFRKS